jgi:hypothetical protein
MNKGERRKTEGRNITEAQVNEGQGSAEKRLLRKEGTLAET